MVATNITVYRLSDICVIFSLLTNPENITKFVIHSVLVLYWNEFWIYAEKKVVLHALQLNTCIFSLAFWRKKKKRGAGLRNESWKIINVLRDY